MFLNQPFSLRSLEFHQTATIIVEAPDVPGKGEEREMSILKKSASAGLVALTLAGAMISTAPAAQAGGRHNDDVWVGVAAGLAGGIIGGAIASQPRRVYVEPEYEYAPPPRPVYRRTYYRAAPRCHYEWVENEWGEAYRARVCY
nr:BA14K family protein [arsenite-oxidising bacterium NT-25]